MLGSWKGTIRVSLFVTLASFLFFAGQLASAPTKPSTIAVGDRLQLHIAFYDDKGYMLASSDEADLKELEATKANFSRPFAIPSSFNTINYLVKSPDRIERFDNSSSFLLSKELVGKQVGFSTILPMIGQLEGYTDQVIMERIRGPFNITATMPVADFDRLASENASGPVVLDDLLPALIVNRNDTHVTLELLVENGDVLNVRQAGFLAHARRDLGKASFSLFLDAAVGHEFSVEWRCKIGSYVLPAGSYRVDEVDKDTITLAKSPQKLPQMVGASPLLSVRVIGVEKATGLGGEI